MTEPGQPWVMISGSASSCSERTWMKWMSTPSISVLNCGSAFSLASHARQSCSVSQKRANASIVASCTPCDRPGVLLGSLAEVTVEPQAAEPVRSSLIRHFTAATGAGQRHAVAPLAGDPGLAAARARGRHSMRASRREARRQPAPQRGSANARSDERTLTTFEPLRKVDLGLPGTRAFHTCLAGRIGDVCASDAQM